MTFYVEDDITYTAAGQVILKLKLDFIRVLIYACALDNVCEPSSPSGLPSASFTHTGTSFK